MNFLAHSGIFVRKEQDSVKFRLFYQGKVGRNRPVATDVLSATVIAHDAATADGLATACMVLGSRDALDMASRLQGVEILLVTLSENSRSPWKIIKSQGFPTPANSD